MGLKEFQKENDDLLKFILNERFFKSWKQDPVVVETKSGIILGNDDITLHSSSHLELFLTSHCNQACEYCYLYKYENELYPKEFNTGKKIIENLKIILQWIIDNDYNINTIDIFTGEIWQSQLGLDVLGVILDYLDKGLKTKNFVIPSNMSFIWDEDQTCKLQNLIYDAADKYHARFCFSASIDGKYCDDDVRPQKDGRVKNDAFYERLFLFCQHNQFYFHPVISATSVFKWKENYDWWKQMCKEYNFIFRKAVMPIDVRNDDWTEEAIKARQDLAEYIFEDYFNNECHGDENELWKHCFPSADRFIEANGYMTPTFNVSYSFLGCSVADTLSIRVGDLAIIPCHRTAYDKFIYGYFKTENGKIVDIKSNNVHTAMKILLMDNKNTNYNCDICKYWRYCTKGCHGAQYEYKKDPFIPAESVCAMIQGILDKKIELYEKYHVIDNIKNITEYDDEYEEVQHFLEFYENVKRKEDIYGKLS